MSFKNANHCFDMGVVLLKYVLKSVLTVWSRPGGGFSICDRKGHDCLMLTKHALPAKIIQAGGDPWSVRGLSDGFTDHYSKPKHLRKGSRHDGRKGRHTDPRDTAFLRANMPAIATMVKIKI